jgi:hypothetical protein
LYDGWTAWTSQGDSLRKTPTSERYLRIHSRPVLPVNGQRCRVASLQTAPVKRVRACSAALPVATSSLSQDPEQNPPAMPATIEPELESDAMLVGPAAEDPKPAATLQIVSEAVAGLKTQRVAATVLCLLLPHKLLTPALESAIRDVGGSMTRIWCDEPGSLLVRLMDSRAHQQLVAGIVTSIDRAIFRDLPAPLCDRILSTGSPHQ